MTVVLSTNIIQGLAVDETEGWLQFLIYGFLSDLYTRSKNMRRLVCQFYLASNLKVSQKKKEKIPAGTIGLITK